MMKNSSSSSMIQQQQQQESIIVVPGGGITESGSLKKWVIKRCELAETLFRENPNSKIFVLSRGTTHKAPPMDMYKRPIHESSQSMRYLVRNLSIPVENIYEENVSLDTIGNAFFLRVIHLDIMFPPGSKVNIQVVTNEFHMPRVKVIFDWVFGLFSSRHKPKYQLSYVSAKDDGFDSELLDLRKGKEEKSLRNLKDNVIPRIVSIQDLHAFIYREHDAYRSECIASPRTCSTITSNCKLADSY